MPSGTDRNATDPVAFAADIAYTAVGLTILGVQRSNVFRRELQADIEKRLGTPLTLPAVAARIADILDQPA